MTSKPLYSTIDIESYGSPSCAVDNTTEIPTATPTTSSPTSSSPINSREGKTKHNMFGHTSHFWVGEHESFHELSSDEERNDEILKSLFISKVYTILSMQLLLTSFISFLFMNITSLRLFSIYHSFGLLIFATIGSFGTLFGLMGYKDVYPLNLQLLSAFTFFESILIGSLCALYQTIGYGDLILQAFAITTLVFITLTIFASNTRIDFTPYVGLLVALLFAMILWGLFMMIFGMFSGNISGMGIVYSWIGVIVFSGFIVIDTQMIMYKFGYDDYIIASIELYLDIINMFLYILRLLASNRDRNN